MKTRYRVGYGGKILLQVYDDRYESGVCFLPGQWVKKWRDARISDFNLTDIKTPEPCPGNAQETTETEKHE